MGVILAAVLTLDTILARKRRSMGFDGCKDLLTRYHILIPSSRVVLFKMSFVSVGADNSIIKPNNNDVGQQGHEAAGWAQPCLSFSHYDTPVQSVVSPHLHKSLHKSPLVQLRSCVTLPPLSRKDLHSGLSFIPRWPFNHQLLRGP